MNINRRADRGRMGKSQKSGKPFGLCAPLRIPLSGIPFSPSLLQAKDDLSINVRKILDTTDTGGHKEFLKLIQQLPHRKFSVQKEVDLLGVKPEKNIVPDGGDVRGFEDHLPLVQRERDREGEEIFAEAPEIGRAHV